MWYRPSVIDFYYILRFTHISIVMADHGQTELPRPTATPRRPGVIANILAIAGFVILIIIVLWGLLHLVSLSTPWFSGLFDGNDDTEIVVTAPAEVAARTPLTISWKHETSSRGTYALLYQCVEGLEMTVGTTKIPCGAAYTLGNATGTATMIPTLTGKTTANANISVLFIPSAAGTTGPEASGSVTVKINAAASTPTTPKPTTPTPTTPKPTTPKPSTPKQTTPTYKPVSPADLKVTIIAVGVIDAQTGAFVKRVPYHSSEIAAVQFDVQNIGGTHSGSYTFQAQIPTSQPYTFSSQVQPSLAPGAHVVNTLRFSPAVNGTFSVQVHINNDARSSNNYATVWVTGAQMGYPTYPQYPQYPQYSY